MTYIPKYSRARIKDRKWKEAHEAFGILQSYAKFKRDLFLIIDESEIGMYLALMMMIRSDQAEEWTDEQKKEKIKQFKEMVKGHVYSPKFYELLDKEFPGAVKKYCNDPDTFSKF